MKRSFRIGDYVQSHYRARWYGVITKMDGEVARILVTHDKAGNPQRKQFIRTLHSHWLSLYNAEGEWKELADMFRNSVCHTM